MTPTEEPEGLRCALAKKAFEGELSAAGLATLWDGRGACAVESGFADAHDSPREAIGLPPPAGCPNPCGALARQLELAGLEERRP